jgi:amidohydrolase
MSHLVNPELFQKMVTLRRDLHQHPELSGHEVRTAEAIMNFLKNSGFTNISRVATTGVVAELSGPSDVPWVILRADTDALPIQEETNLEFSSVNEGIMHACGHDGHTAMLLGAAELLAKESHLPAPVRFIFQPAEEKGAGAKAMIKEGVLEHAGMIFGGHLDRHYPTGTLVVTEGPVNASTDTLYL